MNEKKGMEGGKMGGKSGKMEETVVKRVSNREKDGKGEGQIEK